MPLSRPDITPPVAKPRSAAFRALPLMVALCYAPVAWAQSQADLANAARNAERIQREQDERQRAQLLQEQEGARGSAKISVPQVAPTATNTATGCVDVKRIRIAGAAHLPDAAQADIVQKYVGRCLSLADIQLLLADVVANYIARGEIAARAYIQQQDVSTGTLSILVVEGRLEKIIIDDDGKNSIRIDTAFPGLQGEVLNLRDLEQGLEQIHRLASNQATLDLLPGSEAGATIVSIKNNPGKVWRVNLSADNQGSEASGRDQASAGVSIDNPLGLNDFLSLTHRRTLPTDYAREAAVSNSLTYIVPYGYSTVTLGGSKSLYVSTVHASSGQALRSNGDSSAGFIQVDRILHRNQDSRAGVSATLTVKRTNNYLSDQLLVSSSRQLAVADVDANVSGHALGGIVSFQLGYSQGMGAMGAMHDAADLPDGAPKAQFRKLRYGASYMLPFAVANTDASFSSVLSGQRGIDVLYGSEQILVGGIYSVRGFVNTTLSGDVGYLLRNDLSARMPLSVPGTSGAVLRPYVGLDYGRVSRRGAGTQGGYLSGAAAGVSLSTGAVALDVFNAWPLGMSDGLRRESSRLYVQLRTAL